MKATRCGAAHRRRQSRLSPLCREHAGPCEKREIARSKFDSIADTIGDQEGDPAATLEAGMTRRSRASIVDKWGTGPRIVRSQSHQGTPREPRSVCVLCQRDGE